MPLQQQIRLLRYLIAVGALEKRGPNIYKGIEAKNKDMSRRYRLNATITRNPDGTIASINWEWQSQSTPEHIRRKTPRPGAIA